MIRLLLAVIFIAIVFVIACIDMLVCLVLQKISVPAKNKTIYWVIRLFMKGLTIISGAKITYKGLENISKDEAALYIGNHSSYFDIMFTYSIIPGNLGYIAKKELEKVPIISWAMKLSHSLFLDRDNIKQGLAIILKAIEYIKQGASLFIFPEGTRSKDGKIADFKEGSFKIAMKSGCKIIPVALSNTAEVFENHIPWIKKANVIIEFLPPIDPKSLDKEEQKHIGKKVHDMIEEAVEANYKLL